MDEDRHRRAAAAIDAVNESDPRPWSFGGRERPKAAGEAELAAAWLDRLAPDASEALRLAIRAHHVLRWSIPRADYPMDRNGYLRWRAALKKVHAAEVGRLLADEGYERAVIERVEAIVQKRDLKHDAEVQTFEDALCLVFLESQFGELTERLDDDEKMIDVVAKTLPKMTDAGRALALDLANGLSAREQSILAAALAQ